MSKEKLAFVSFEPQGDGFQAFMSIEDFAQTTLDLEPQLKKASSLYDKYILRMRCTISEIRSIRKSGCLTPARKVWKIGDTIFGLTQQLAKLSFQIDGLYEHLVRDLDVKRKWLEKVVILRRYIPTKETIPESSNWGQFEKGTRKAAIRLTENVDDSDKK
ncbi:MAG: hypothetical protein WAV28_17435 [Sedimentisphaerales bacterium]|jgi:hypothetical protein